ncbi:glutathione S-transferase T3-like [Apium graveolens]
MNNQNSPHSQVSAFDGTNIIDLNDEHDEFENSREIIGQWKWSEDKLLISAWLNVSIDPLVGTDQKADAFWDRIRQYCEESNPGLIKRGVQAIKKRWQRINEGAQRYGSCYDQAERKIGSGSNVDNIIELAHELHKARYKKKSNFDKHWSELRKQPKWRTPSSSGSAKRTKLSDSGAYSSSANNETPTNDNDVAMSPVRPQGTKTTKRKSKGKAKAEMIEELEEIKAVENRRLSLLEKFNANHEKEMDLKIIMADTSVMNEAQLKVHATLLEEIIRKRS